MKVLFVTPWYPTRAAPHAGTFVREHARAAARFDDLTVIHVEGGAPDVRTWDMAWEREPVLTAGIRTARLRHRPLPSGAGFLGTFLALEGALRALAAGGHRPDVIHAHVYDVAWAAAILGRPAGIPVVVTEHHSGFPRRLLTRGALLKARIAFRLAARVLPVSHALGAAIRPLAPRGRFQVVANAVDTALFHPPDPGMMASRRLLFVGSLLPVKGVATLVDALAMLPGSEGDVVLDVVGDGPERRALEERAAAAGVAKRVAWHGFLPKERVAEMMRDASVFVLPSAWENLPCVLLEATCSGLPIVASRVGGIPEIVREGGGILVPPGDAAALAAAMGQVLAGGDVASRAEIAARGRPYALDVVGRELHAIYGEVARAIAPRGGVLTSPLA